MKFLTIPLCNLLFLLIFSNTLHAQTVKRGPYLQSGTSSSIIIKWRTSENTESKVWYGTSPNNLSQTVYLPERVKDHEILIDGLNAKTKYHYAIGDKDNVFTGDNNKHYFMTSPEIGERGFYRAWILGDCGTGNSNARQVRDSYYNWIGDRHTDLMLLLGDNAYDDGEDWEYQDAIFEDMYEDKLVNTVLWPCPGNHDYGNDEADGIDQTGPYYDIFSVPKNAEAGGVASGTEAYYSYDYGNMHIISMDSHDVDREVGGPMLNWLENDLAANNQEWTIVYFHHPPYTKGSHDSDDEEDSGRRMHDMRENVLPILERYKVDLVLSGHSHSYERSFMIHGHYGESNSFNSSMIQDGGDGQRDGDGRYRKKRNIDNGTVYVVAGVSGKTGSGDLDHPIMYYSDNPMGSTILEVEGDEMTVKFLNKNGNIDDHFTMVKIAANCPTAGTSCDDGNPNTINDTEDGYCRCEGVDNSENTVCHYIANSKDDVEENGENGKIAVTSSDLELTFDSKNGSSHQIVGVRYPYLGIPQGAMITEAYIQFTVDEKNSGDTDLIIYGEATNHSLPFGDDRYELTDRSATSARAHWSPSAWNTVRAAGNDQRTPDLKEIIQEIVSRPGFSQNSALSIMIKGTGERTAYSYDKEAEKSALLCITYSACPPPGMTCDDNDPCTINDVTDDNCNCKGTWVDSDNDGVCNAQDLCPGFDDTVDDDNDGIPDSCDDCDGLIVENACDDGEDCTINDVYDAACNCEGVFIDADEDGFCVSDDPNDADPCDPDNSGPGCDTGVTPPGSGADCLTLDFQDFETDWGLWQDGGSDAIRNYWDEDMANSGETSIELRDDTGENGSIFTESMDFTAFASAKISFSLIADDMEPEEDFFLEVSLDGGANFEIVEEWNEGREFENLVRQEIVSEVSGFDFTDKTVFRLRCDANCDEDMIFIDDLKIEACLTAGNRDEYEEEQISLDPSNEFGARIYPNPVVSGSLLQMEMTGVKEFLNIYIFDRGGNPVKMYKVTNPDSPYIEIPTDFMDIGVYIIQFETQGETVSEKILVAE